ncbi:MAG: hypothetical protein K6E54_09325 [Bacteroidaceae bacterium]|nr:hypothetical protein [Bacteroidaceae bacterium]
MKKIYFLFVMTLVALAANAQDYEFGWGYLYDGPTKAGDNAIAIEKAADGNIFEVISWGSTEADGQNLYINSVAATDGQNNTIEGYAYNSGNSYTANTYIAKLNPETGVAIWNVYTIQGYMDNSGFNIAATKDGGAVIAMKIRQSQGADATLAEFVSATGVHTTIAHDNSEQWCYRTIVMKLTSAGEISWYRVIRQDDTFDGNNSSDSHYTYTLALDEDENIYIGGNYRNNLYFPKADGSEYSITAHNNSGWTGDSQKVIGDLYIVKLNSNGYFEKVLTSPETVDATFIDRIIADGNTFYAVGRAADATSDSFTVGGKTVNTTSLQGMFVLSFDTDLNVNYASTIEATGASDSKHTTQIKNLQLVNGSLYISGGVKGGFKQNETTFISTSSTMIEGFSLKVSVDNGTVEKGYIKGYGITSIFGVNEINDDKLLTIGYYMSGSKGALGCVADIYAADGTLESNKQLVSFGTVATMACPLFDGDDIYIQNRGGSNAAPSFYDCADTYQAGTKWGVALSKYTLSYAYRIKDDDHIAYTNSADDDSQQAIKYVRTFNNTEWQALYIPFSVSYDEWSDDFEVTKINNVLMYDTNSDGEVDETALEIIKVKSGSLIANHPYLIKAKTTGKKSIIATGATLVAAENNSIDCSSTEFKFTVTGTYDGVSGEDMYTNGYYALSAGSLYAPTSSENALYPYRWYLSVESRGSQVISITNGIKIRVYGEDDATDINGVLINSTSSEAIYSVDGRVVSKDGNASNLRSGLYIKGGKKFLVK